MNFKTITLTVMILHPIEQAPSSEIQRNLRKVIYSESNNDLIQVLFEMHIWH